jgi:peroxiredoxin
VITYIADNINLEESCVDDERKAKLENKVESLKKFAVGLKAPDFTAKDPNGKIISLKQSLGKVTIVDFWASWCGPCRKENPNVVALYNEFHSKGLNIIGVSLDDELNEWKNAIQKDKITWTQVSNLKKWSDPVAKLYEVEQIPSTFILDSNGTIVAKDLRGEELKAKIKELLGS